MGLKILQLQYRLSTSGDFVRRLQHAFNSIGVESTSIALYSDVSSTDGLMSLGKKAKLRAIVDRRLQKILKGTTHSDRGMFSYPILGTRVSDFKEAIEADVIYLHWILLGYQNFAGIESLLKLGKPVIVIMHDMWSITGGCHHSFDCQKYNNNCQQCQIFVGQQRLDLAKRQFKIKQRLYRKYDNLYFVAPSKWLFECTKRAALTKGKPVYHIPNVLNRDTYQPIPKKQAREILNLDRDRVIIAFGAVNIENPYKGWRYLKSALKELHHLNLYRNAIILVFGKMNDEAMADLPYEIRPMGHVRDEITMSLIYNSASIFIAPSLADNLPYTVYESLACGTPVVAFDIGGIPDLVIHKRNGYLAPYREKAELVKGIRFCLDQDLKGFLPAHFETQKIMGQHLDLISEARMRSSKLREIV